MSTAPNIRKAAILLATLPRDQAAGLLTKIGRADLSRLTAAIAAMDSLPAAHERAILAEFLQSLAGTGSPAGSWFSSLSEADLPELAAILAGEHPQTAALVIARLPRKLAVRLLAEMPRERQGILIRRIAALGPVDPQALREVEIGLRLRLEEFRLPAARSTRKSA